MERQPKPSTHPNTTQFIQGCRQSPALLETTMGFIQRNGVEDPTTGCAEWNGPHSGRVLQPRLVIPGFTGHRGVNMPRVLWHLCHPEEPVLPSEVYIHRVCRTAGCVHPDHLAAAHRRWNRSVISYREVYDLRHYCENGWLRLDRLEAVLHMFRSSMFSV